MVIFWLNVIFFVYFFIFINLSISLFVIFQFFFFFSGFFLDGNKKTKTEIISIVP